MNNNSEEERINALANRQGIFGFGFSNNNHLDLLNLIVLAGTGLIIAIFFEGNPDKKNGLQGMASSNIWGYGITCVALFLLLFMSFYSKNREKDLKKVLEINNKNQNEESDNLLLILIKLLLNDSLPILLAFSILVYAITLNKIFFIRINKQEFSSTYFTYDFYFKILLIVQIGIIVKYIYNLLKKNDGSSNSIIDKQTFLLKSLSYILSTINFLFLFIMHILLHFFSTDG